MWEKLKGFDRLFSDDIRNDEFWFFRRMYAPDTVVLETDGGIMLLTGVVPGKLAACHVSFWDKKLTPKMGIIQEAIRWAFLQFDLQRMEALIPEYSRMLRRFCNGLDFILKDVLENEWNTKAT